jgi:hypothetical protein
MLSIKRIIDNMFSGRQPVIFIKAKPKNTDRTPHAFIKHVESNSSTISITYSYLLDGDCVWPEMMDREWRRDVMNLLKGNKLFSRCYFTGPDSEDDCWAFVAYRNREPSPSGGKPCHTSDG